VILDGIWNTKHWLNLTKIVAFDSNPNPVTTISWKVISDTIASL